VVVGVPCISPPGSGEDARTGALKWEYPAVRTAGRGTANRGVVVAEGKVFSAIGNNPDRVPDRRCRLADEDCRARQ
jgi:hypothetical protein